MKNYFMKSGMPGEQNLFNKGYRLEITHLPTDYSVAFSAFIDQMSDSYNADWASEHVYGRMDPIGTFTRTKRNLSLVWRVPASSAVMARDNLDKINRLITFLYPTYDSKVGATMMNQSPLWRVKFGNLVCNPDNGEGLLGWVRGITMDPILDEGVFIFDGKPGRSSTFIGPTPPERTRLGAGVEYYPKSVRLNIELAVVHEHQLGWESVGSTENGDEIFAFGGNGNKQRHNHGGMSFPYASTRFVSDPVHELSQRQVDSLIDAENAFFNLFTSEDPLGNLRQLAENAISPTDKPVQESSEAKNALKKARK